MNGSPTPSSLSHCLSQVLQALRAVLAARAGRDRTAAAVVLLAWPYLHRVAARFAALAGRVAAGRAAIAPARAGTGAGMGAGTGAGMGAGTRAGTRDRLPRGPGWLIRLAPGALPLAGQVRHLLADPEFATLLAAAPQAGRILRPLCRMLGILPGPDLPPALFGPPAAAALAAPSPAVTAGAAAPATSHAPAAPDALAWADPIALPAASPPRRRLPFRPPRASPAPA